MEKIRRSRNREICDELDLFEFSQSETKIRESLGIQNHRYQTVTYGINKL